MEAPCCKKIKNKAPKHQQKQQQQQKGKMFEFNFTIFFQIFINKYI